MNQQVEEFIRQVVLPGAAEVLEKDGEVIPISFLLYEGGGFGVALSDGFADDDDKRHYAQAVNKIALGDGDIPPAIAVIYLAEAWYTDIKPEELAAWRKQYGSPSGDPGRKEGVFIFYTTAGLEFGGRRVPIIRDENGQPNLDLLSLTEAAPDGFLATNKVPNPWQVGRRQGGVAA